MQRNNKNSFHSSSISLPALLIDKYIDKDNDRLSDIISKYGILLPVCEIQPKGSC